MVQQRQWVARVLSLFLAGVTTTTACVFACPGMGDMALPAELGSRLGSGATAEDHRSAASIYLRQAQEAEMTASRMEDSVKAVTQLEDPKEFRRSSLRMAAQQCRKQAAELRKLAEQHEHIAGTL